MDIDNLKTSIRAGIDSVRRVSPDTPVVVGVLRKDLDEVIDLANFAKELGADAIVYAPGYTECDNYDGLNRLIQSTDMSIILYNNPEFQPDGINIPFEFVQDAASHPNVIGIKDTSRSLPYFTQLLTLRNSDTFHVFQGDTKTKYLNEQLADIDGMVAVEANIAPEALVTAWNNQGTNDLNNFQEEFVQRKKEHGGTLQAIKHELATTQDIFISAEMYKTSS